MGRRRNTDGLGKMNGCAIATNSPAKNRDDSKHLSRLSNWKLCNLRCRNFDDAAPQLCDNFAKLTNEVVLKRNPFLNCKHVRMPSAVWECPTACCSNLRSNLQCRGFNLVNRFHPSPMGTVLAIDSAGMARRYHYDTNNQTALECADLEPLQRSLGLQAVLP